MNDELFASVYIDECVPSLVVFLLRKEGWNVTGANEINVLGISDKEQLKISIQRKAVFVLLQMHHNLLCNLDSFL